MIKDDNNVWENKSQRIPETYIGQSMPLNTGGSGNVKSFDIDLRRILSVWPWVILFAALGFAVGKIFLRYIDPVYLVSTSIKIEQNQDVTIGQALSGSTRDPFNDEIAYFKSPAFAELVVDSLGLQFRSSVKGRFKDKDLYGIIKWYAYKDSGMADTQLSFTIQPEKDSFRFASNIEKGVSKWNEPFNIRGYRVIVKKLKELPNKSTIHCISHDKLSEAFELSKGILITNNKESNVINISYSDISSDRAIDILNGLTILYDQVLKKDKTKSFLQAIGFIESRIGPLGRELDSIETAIARFKSGKEFIGTTANGEVYQDKMKTIEDEKNEIDVLQNTVTAVERYISNPSLKEGNIAFVGITDAFMQSVVAEYQQMRSERDKLALTLTPGNPALELAESHLRELKENMFNQLQIYKNNLKTLQNLYAKNLEDTHNQIKGTPADEKELGDKYRMQSIKETLFLTLLTKREEAGISRASVTVNTKVLYPPVKLNAPAKPSPPKIMAAATLIGLLIPFIFALFKELSNKKIISKKQLRGITSIPVLAELEQTDLGDASGFVIGEEKRSMIGEQIRTLRTNLNFYQTEGKKTTFILITSSMSGEGKSFLSLNLARSYSLQGKKVALFEFDLRRPKMSKVLGIIKPPKGISTVLLGKCELPDIIHTPANLDPEEHFDFFPAGPIPPNPQELIGGVYLKKVKEYVDLHYDVVIMDSPPFGIVADAQILGEWADVTLIMTRFQLTIKEQVQEINEWEEKGLFKRMAIIFNGVKNKGYFGYRHGNYYYKRRYGYSYYTKNNAETKQ